MVLKEYKLNFNNIPINFASPGSVPKSNVVVVDNAVVNNNNKLPKLFTPLTIKNMTIKNRLIVPPLCMYTAEDGFFNDWHFSHYTGFAKGGAGLIIIEATGVLPEGRISYGCTGLWKDEHIENIKRVVDFSHQFNCKIGIQIAHAGRKASSHPPFLAGAKNSHITIKPDDPSGNGWPVVGPSPIAWNDDMAIPSELSISEIENVIDAFKQAAKRCVKIGFDFLEIHGAHGYLISSFLSSTSNKRTDSYGGSFEGRIKLLLEVIKAVRSEWSTEKPLGIRYSASEWVDDENGWTIEDSIKLANVLKSYDVDLLDISSGGNNKDQKIKAYPLYQVPFSSEIKKSLESHNNDSSRINKLFVSAVGMITNANEAESILQSDHADAVMIGRAFLRNPHLPIEFAQQLNLKIDYSLQYQQSRIYNKDP